MPNVKNIGKPCALVAHARFDEGGQARACSLLYPPRGLDNERGKGDHKHFGAIEVAYEFKGIASLLADFWLDVNGRVK